MNTTMADLAMDVPKRLRDLGVRCKGADRIGKMAVALLSGYVAPTDPQFRVALEAWRDIQILAFVLASLRGQVPDEELRARFQRCLKDAVLPQDSLARSPGRDAQSELYVAAVCARAAMHPRFAEPDILCECGGTYGIAVKRIKSIDKIEQRFREAVAQIEKSQLPGFVAMDITLAVNRDNVPLCTNASAEQMHRAHHLARGEFRRTQYEKMRELARGREVRGYILIDHILRYHGAQGWFLDTFTFEDSFCSGNQRRQREFDVFIEVYTKGLGNLQ